MPQFSESAAERPSAFLLPSNTNLLAKFGYEDHSDEFKWLKLADSTLLSVFLGAKVQKKKHKIELTFK